MLVDETDAAENPSEDIIIWTEKDMGEPVLQFNVCGDVVELVRDYARATGMRCRIGGNLLFRYDPGDPAAQVTPDVYVLAGEPDDDQDISCWSTWERGGKAPVLAIEVVSKTSKKDYAKDPKGMLARYQLLGVKEVVRYDPLWARHRRSKRRLLTHWVRSEAGVLEEQELAQPNMVQIKSLGIWLVHTPARRLRIGQGAPGSMEMWPTRLERIARADERATAEAERAETEAQRATIEAQRAEAEAQRAEAEAQRATAEAQRATAAEQRATTAEQRATAEAQRATGAEQRAATEAQRAAAEAKRAATEAKRAAAEAQRATAAESELKALREELRRLKKGRPR